MSTITVKSGTSVVWADTADYAGDGGAWTHQIDLTDLADGAARQGAKADLGATRAERFAVTFCAEMAVAPASGAVVDLYWAASPHAVAATMNPGGCSGSDAAYTGTAGDSLNDSLKQLIFIGSLILTSDTDPVLHSQTFVFSPPHRYGMPVVDNNGGQAMHSDAIECFVTLTPIEGDIT